MTKFSIGDRVIVLECEPGELTSEGIVNFNGTVVQVDSELPDQIWYLVKLDEEPKHTIDCDEEGLLPLIEEK